MSKLLLLPLLMSFSNTAIAFEGNDMYQYGYSWGGMSSSCLGYYVVGFPKKESKMIFKSYYEASKNFENREIYNMLTKNMYEKDKPMYKNCRDLYPE